MGRAVQIDAILAGVIDPNTGAPCAGGTIYFYEPGGTTGKNVWTEAAKSNDYTSYTLDNAGAAHLYADGIYDVVIKNSSGTIIASWDGLKLRYPDFEATSISASYTQETDDDAIVLSPAATAAVTITLLDSDDWEDKPLVVVNANDSYAITVNVDGDSSDSIDGGSSIVIPVGASAVTIFKSGTTFYSSGNGTSKVLSTGSTGRYLTVTDNGAKDVSEDFASSFYMMGGSAYSMRLICARIDISYSAASQINVTISSSTSYGFEPPATASSGALAAGGSANGFTVFAGGIYVSFANTIMYPHAADTAYFTGVLPVSNPVYVITTSGPPSFRATYSSTALTLYYYEDGAAGDIIAALATSGDTISVILAYLMRPVA